MRTIGFTIFLFFLILSSLSLPGQASLSHTKVSDDALPTENGPSFPSDSMYLATGQALNQPDLTIDDFLDALYPLLDAERSWLYILSDRGYLLDEHFAEAEERILQLHRTIRKQPLTDSKLTCPYLFEITAYDELSRWADELANLVRAYRYSLHMNRISTANADTFSLAMSLEALARLNYAIGNEELHSQQLKQAASYYRTEFEPFYTLDLLQESARDTAEVDRYFKEAFAAAQSTGDTTGMIRVLYTNATKNYDLNRPDQRLAALLQIVDLAKGPLSYLAEGDVFNTYGELAEIYAGKDSTRLAMHYAYLTLEMAAFVPELAYSAALILGRGYQTMNQPDSALYYLQLAEAKKNYLDDHGNTADMERAYLQAQFQKERERLLRKKRTQKRKTLWLVIGIFFTTILAIINYRHYRLKKYSALRLQEIYTRLTREQVRLARTNGQLQYFTKGVSENIQVGLNHIATLGKKYAPKNNNPNSLSFYFEEMMAAVTQTRSYCSRLLRSTGTFSSTKTIAEAPGDRLLSMVLQQNREFLNQHHIRVVTNPLGIIPMTDIDLALLLHHLIEYATRQTAGSDAKEIIIRRHDGAGYSNLLIHAKGLSVPVGEIPVFQPPSLVSGSQSNELSLAIARSIAQDYGGEIRVAPNRAESLYLCFSIPGEGRPIKGVVQPF